MRVLAFFLLIGLASAVSIHQVQDAEDEFLVSFSEAEALDENTKTELGKKLKEGVDRVLQKIKETVDEGKEVKQELLDKLKELRNRLRDIKVDVGERSKQLLKDIKEKARDYLRQILENLGLDKKPEVAHSELTFKDMLRKLREHLKNNVDPDLLKEKLEKIFGQGTQILQHLLKTLKEKGKKKLEMLIDTLLEDQEDDRKRRGIGDYWQKIKDYFKDLKIDLQEKYMKFGEWVKEVYGKGKESSKDKLENIAAIAKEFMKHAKNVSKEVGSEASEFFKQYKDDLKNIWEELQETFKEIRNRKDN